MSNARSEHYILFMINDTAYALPSEDVAHVEMIEQITAVPNAAAFVDGVVFSRGEVVPAVNMRARFGFGRSDATLRTRLLVVQVQRRSVGLVVDSCREFISIPASAIHPPGDALCSAVNTSYISGIATIGDRVVVLLNLETLLHSAAPLTAASA